MGAIDQDDREPGGHAVADAECPWQVQWNVATPGIAVEPDRLAFACSILAIGDKVVPGHGPAQQLDRGVLQWWRKRSQPRSVRHHCNCAALRKIGSLLDPAAERQA